MVNPGLNPNVLLEEFGAAGFYGMYYATLKLVFLDMNRERNVSTSISKYLSWGGVLQWAWKTTFLPF
jgi:hypothetical protein